MAVCGKILASVAALPDHIPSSPPSRHMFFNDINMPWPGASAIMIVVSRSSGATQLLLTAPARPPASSLRTVASPEVSGLSTGICVEASSLAMSLYLWDWPGRRSQDAVSIMAWAVVTRASPRHCRPAHPSIAACWSGSGSCIYVCMTELVGSSVSRLCLRTSLFNAELAPLMDHALEGCSGCMATAATRMPSACCMASPFM
mmetsp:Transcript_6001/g.15457  ORF Transcript_6001/g.15457 Transcript_6001/m.15457 type:complete len:202 (-) Transcript_6001:108-713(-)